MGSKSHACLNFEPQHKNGTCKVGELVKYVQCKTAKMEVNTQVHNVDFQSNDRGRLRARTSKGHLWFSVHNHYLAFQVYSRCVLDVCVIRILNYGKESLGKRNSVVEEAKLLQYGICQPRWPWAPMYMPGLEKRKVVGILISSTALKLPVPEHLY